MVRGRQFPKADESMSRAPSTEAHEAVLSTALKLMTDRGIEGTSVDEIAQVSGVSKATIYKHWTSKDVLCIEAISRLKCDLPVFDSGNPRADVAGLLRHLAHTKKPEALSRIWPRVIGYAAEQSGICQSFSRAALSTASARSWPDCCAARSRRASFARVWIWRWRSTCSWDRSCIVASCSRRSRRNCRSTLSIPSGG